MGVKGGMGMMGRAMVASDQGLSRRPLADSSG